MNVELMRTLFNRCEGINIQLNKDIDLYNAKIVELQKKIKVIEKSQVFLQTVAQKTQGCLKFQVEDVVNLALETCFPGEYLFKINFAISRGKTESELVFLDQKTNREIDPMNSSGGGVVDLTAFALRIACYALEQNVDNVIILDEPFRFLSRDLQDRAGEILKKLSEKMNIQIIMVSHINDIINVSDKVFEVKKDEDGVSRIKEIIN